MAQPQRDLTRTVLAALFIGGMLFASFTILSPFLPAVVWAATVVIASWPIMLHVEALFGHRRRPAVAVMTIALVVVFVVPFWFAIGTIVSHSGQIAGWAETIASFKVPLAPDWLAHLPLIGDRAAQTWNEAADSGLHDLAPRLTPYAGRVTNWFVAEVGNLGLLLVQVLLTVIIAGIMFQNGERAADLAVRFGGRLAGARGEAAVFLAGRAIRGVALAVVVTAVVQSLISGLAMGLAGVPFASILTALTFMMCVAQLGPSLVLVPVVIWMYATGQTAWASFMLVATIVVLGLDNVLRPILIRKGADVPILLILAGVIGGLLAYGLVGIFLGPTVLAVGYTLLQAWTDEDAEEAINAPPALPPAS
ncbi:MAG: AI-2E family transporter YdiK [Rhodospirillales bacterium]|nr:AI-2E family transporter YdiK [Rhodospirillales bacterium]